jgi:hypothetical protein
MVFLIDIDWTYHTETIGESQAINNRHKIQQHSVSRTVVANKVLNERTHSPACGKQASWLRPVAFSQT